MKQKCFIFQFFSYICDCMIKETDMKLRTESANTMRELVEFVNEHHIEKDNIVSMAQTKDGLYLLVYFGED